MAFIHVVVENKSKYPIEIVWENAQDLEHVGFLHRQTNRAFTLMHVDRKSDSPWQYDVMVYRGVRRLFCFGLQSMGFRTIKSEFNIHQVEYIPLLKITSSLNSLLYRSDDPEYPTLMRDEIVMEVPFWMAPLKAYFQRSLARHTKIQCAEDEPFRERRLMLKTRGINLPYRIFFETKYEQLTRRFKESVTTKERKHGNVAPERPSREGRHEGYAGACTD